MPLAYEEVEKIIKKVPPAEKGMPALIVESKDYTWKEILIEIKKKSELSKQMLIKIEEIRKHGRKISFTDEELILAKKRLEAMPSDLNVITLGK